MEIISNLSVWKKYFKHFGKKINTAQSVFFKVCEKVDFEVVLGKVFWSDEFLDKNAVWQSVTVREFNLVTFLMQSEKP